jgi:hypothetical protein
LEDCSEYGNCVITLISRFYYLYITFIVLQITFIDLMIIYANIITMLIKNRLKTITKTFLLDILIELSPLSLDWISDAHN